MNLNKYLVALCLSVAYQLPIHSDLDPSQTVESQIESEVKLDIPQEIEIQLHKCWISVLESSSSNPDVFKLFERTSKEWVKYYYKQDGNFDIQTLLKAVAFAAIKHKGQTRKDEAVTPSIIHPIGVARSLWKEGKIRSVNVLTAALLHDTLEATDSTPKEIEALFGPRVRYTVEELTNDPSLTTQENKQRQVDHAPYLSLDAQLVKLADRLYNIRDLRNSPPSWIQEDISVYLQWEEKLLKALNGTHLKLEKNLKKEISNLSN